MLCRFNADHPQFLEATTILTQGVCPRESLRLVTEAHRHFSPVREAGCASQPQRRRTALAESHQMKACASQDGNQSAVALGVGLGSLTHRGWHPSSERVSVRTLRQSYITPHCIKCMASQSQAPFVSPHRFAPCGFTQQALCKIAFAGAVASRRRSPVASRPTRRRLSPWWCAGVVAYVRRFAHGSGQRLRRASCVCPRPPLGLACFAASPARSARPPPEGAPSEPREDTPPAGGGLLVWLFGVFLMGFRYVINSCFRLFYKG